MAAIVDTYTPAAYEPRAMDSLPDIDVTAGIFADRKGYETMKSIIRGIFLKHGMQDTFGVGLLHKHYELASNERIVELGPVSSPWVIGESDKIVGGTIFAHTWRVYQGELRPVEYSFVAERDVATANRPSFPTGFAREIIQAFEVTGLDDVLSINIMDRNEHDGDFTEITYGRSSIVIPTTQEEESKMLEDSNLQGFQAAWAFTHDTVNSMHRNCLIAKNQDGAESMHRNCLIAKSRDGVTSMHRNCLIAKDSDGVKSLHRNCLIAKDQDGVSAMHRNCLISKDSDGVQSLHRNCLIAKDVDGVRSLHRNCLIAKDGDGIKSLHRNCLIAKDGATDMDGVKSLHRNCLIAKDAVDGVKSLHRNCLITKNAGN